LRDDIAAKVKEIEDLDNKNKATEAQLIDTKEKLKKEEADTKVLATSLEDVVKEAKSL